MDEKSFFPSLSSCGFIFLRTSSSFERGKDTHRDQPAASVDQWKCIVFRLKICQNISTRMRCIEICSRSFAIAGAIAGGEMRLCIALKFCRRNSKNTIVAHNQLTAAESVRRFPVSARAAAAGFVGGSAVRGSTPSSVFVFGVNCAPQSFGALGWRFGVCIG